MIKTLYLLLALLVGSGSVFAAPHITLESGNGTELGTASNPIYVSGGGGGDSVQRLQYALSDETTALTTGAAKLTWRSPCAMTVTNIRASVITAPTGATVIVDVNEGGATLMSTNKLSIDANEKTSATAATPIGLTDTTIADDAEITADIDQVGAAVAGAGLKVTIYGTCS